MLEALNGLSQIIPTNNSAIVQQQIAAFSEHSTKLLQVKMQSAESFREAIMRQQLESMLMNAEKSIANEESSRTLSSVFNKFSLLQKIMQTMG